MLRDLKNNENGIVFVTVLMIIVVIMTITVGIISLNVSQVTFTESEIQRIKSKMLAMGTLAYVFAKHMTATPSNSISLTETLDGITYAITANVNYGTDDLLIEVDY